MKKNLFFAMMAAVLGLISCSKEETAQPETAQKGMVLHATVAQSEETKATFTDNEGVWHFSFANGDQITVYNKVGDNTSYDYTFTYNGTDFISTDAEPTSEPARWYAFYPSKEVSLVGQTGKWEELANVYALVGSTPYGSNVTGKEGLDITMEPKCAILKIINQKGSIDINVKNKSNGYWIKGLSASGSSFVPSHDEAKQTLLSTTEMGTYYIAVPAGIALTVYDGEKVIRSTSKGLTKGKYYELTILGQTKGVAKRTGDIDVNWVQLWEDGPKFAEYNVGAENNKPEDYGGYFTWGGIYNNNPSLEGFKWTDDHYAGASNLSGNTDTAYNLWGQDWRMPTKEDFNALIANCTVEWIDGDTRKYKDTNVKGILFTGNDYYSSNSIFLPAAGESTYVWNKVEGYHCEMNCKGTQGYYWTSTFNANETTYYLPFSKAVVNMTLWRVDYVTFDHGYSVRAVLNE